MSLFPAYAKDKQPSSEHDSNIDIQNKSTQQWLNNPSFQETLCIPKEVAKGLQLIDKTNEGITEASHASNSEVVPPKKRRKTEKPKPEINLHNEDFSIELKGFREFLSVNTLTWPAVAKYKVKYNLKCLQKKGKEHKFERYFQTIIDNEVTNDKLGKKNEMDKLGTKDEGFTGFIQEEELSKKTASYNKHLTQYPCDVQMWLEYVKFQDVVYQFEKTYRKGSIAKAQRVLAERKLSILDKALSFNVNSEVLQRERLDVAVGAFPADELQSYFKNLLDKNKGDIVLWQGYIEATQCSMSHCNTHAVLDLYIKCLSTLHQLRRTTSLEKHLMEECILKMLYQCGLFFKQAGLFEQLWTLLKMYLELNLSPNERSKFDIGSEFHEKHLIELEEVIFTSQLPLHELWLRTEKLRESCHWLPYLGDSNCEDPQRLVFPEDVAELIHPITTVENIFKLTVTIFSLLKIPLLPCRHLIMQELGLDYLPWSLDSIEPLLPVFLPMYPVNIINESFLKDNKLVVGPQFLKPMPGQEEYLKFVLQIMKNCSDCLMGDAKVAVKIWWFRFQRLLVILDKKKHTKLSEQLKKQIRQNTKNVLKLSENRQNVLYYLEYGLLEKEFGNLDSCKNIISVALKMNENISFDCNEWTLAHSQCCYLNRQQIQLILEVDEINEPRIILLLCQFVLKKKIDKITDKILVDAYEVFVKITTRVIQMEMKSMSPCYSFLPDFATEWIICNSWFLYFTRGITAYYDFMKNTIDTLDLNNKNPCLQKEILYESYTAFMLRHCCKETNSNVITLLEEVLYKALEIYPNNLFLLSVLMKKQCLTHSFGPPWWRVQNLLLKSGRALSTVFAVIILNQQLINSQDVQVDSITGKKYGTNISLKNRLLSLFKRITSSNMATRRCGLLWRLYLEFVYTYYSPDICRNVYYTAVEECPWLKALYIDAAIYIPAELPQIQDLLIEKQLRLHVTPEELNVLRN